MKFEIFFLGTSAGVPSVERNMPCIAVRANGNVYLFDAGECCQKQLMKYKVGYGSIRNIFISHLHLDHFLGIYGLIETLRMTTDIKFEKLNIFAPKGFSSLLINKWDFLNIQKIRQGKLIKEYDIEIGAFKTKHVKNSYGFYIKEEDRIKFNAEKAHSLGIRGELFRKIKERGSLTINGREVLLEEISYKIRGRKIVYTGDTMYSENTIKFSEGADVLIHEATFDESLREDALKSSHSTVKDAALIAKKAGVRTLVLTHISARYKKENSNLLIEEAKKYYDGDILVAYDGMILKI